MGCIRLRLGFLFGGWRGVLMTGRMSIRGSFSRVIGGIGRGFGCGGFGLVFCAIFCLCRIACETVFSFR